MFSTPVLREVDPTYLLRTLKITADALYSSLQQRARHIERSHRYNGANATLDASEVDYVEEKLRLVKDLFNQVQPTFSSLTVAPLPPIYTLPSELLLAIFSCLLESSPTSCSVPDIISVSHVCSFWRNVALGQSALWASGIHLDWPASRLAEYSTRTNTRPLAVALTDRHWPYASMFEADYFSPTISRWRDLSLHSYTTDDTADPALFIHRALYAISQTSARPPLESLSLTVHTPNIDTQTNICLRRQKSQLQSVRKLALKDIVIDAPSLSRAMPNLVELTVHVGQACDAYRSARTWANIMGTCTVLESLDVTWDLDPDIVLQSVVEDQRDEGGEEFEVPSLKRLALKNPPPDVTHVFTAALCRTKNPVLVSVEVGTDSNSSHYSTYLEDVLAMLGAVSQVIQTLSLRGSSMFVRQVISPAFGPNFDLPGSLQLPRLTKIIIIPTETDEHLKHDLHAFIKFWTDPGSPSISLMDENTIEHLVQI